MTHGALASQSWITLGVSSSTCSAGVKIETSSSLPAAAMTADVMLLLATVETVGTAPEKFTRLWSLHAVIRSLKGSRRSTSSSCALVEYL